MASMEATQVPVPAPLKRVRPIRHRPAKVRGEVARLDFFGCDAVSMFPVQYSRFEERLEVWDVEPQTAWILRESPPGFIHESLAQHLGGLVEHTAAEHGSPIACCGTPGLMVADRHGEPRRVRSALAGY